MDLVTGAMGNLAPKLLQLLQDEYKLQTGVREQVQSLSKELENIHTALRKVAAVPWDQLDEQVKVWAREVREVSYDMEDILDTFLVRVQGRETVDQGRLKRALKKMGDLFSKGKARREIAGAIEDIRKQLQEVAERRARYKVDENLAKPAARTSTIDPRLAAMYKEVTQLIGIDKARGELISMLSYQHRDDDVPEKEMKKVSVVGVGGLGKTTLAKAVYDKLKGDFNCGAFVPVGRNPDINKVLKDMLYELDKERYENIHSTTREGKQLIDLLREFLRNKRYFIVIDDIWETQSWEIIKLALVENNCGSRIIATTRKFEVAREAGEVYKLQPLSCDDSKKLFYTRIFGGDGKCLDNQPDEILDKILKKCDGIPLAIITMASLLVGKPREEWCELYSAIGFGHKDNMHVENTMRILSFSYYDLPSHLKTCLLYLSAFPEDYVIEKDLLIWKWIAEGFVHKKQGKLSLFELGEGYFNDLLNRSMIQAVESEWDGMVEGCRVHDMVLDLIRSLSREENFVAISDNVEGTLSQGKVRRLVHQNRTMENNTHQADHMDMSQVRSYIASRCDISQRVLLSSFKLLRVLAIENCRFGEDCHLENLGNLLHLRYLGLSGTNIRELPKEIEDLKFLQTLDVAETSITELPASVVLLTQLVCLRADWLNLSVSDGIGKLTSLEELRMHAVCDDKSQRRFVKELGSLRELRVLVVSIDCWMDESQQRELVESLRNLHKIQHLTLRIATREVVDIATWEAAGFTLPRHLQYLVLLFEFSRLPSCINPARLPNLTTLELWVASLDERDLKLLDRLTELRYLMLASESTVTVSNINASDGCFQKLRVFILPYSMVQFERNKEDSSVSLHIWNGTDAMPFKCSTENDCSLCAIPSAVMPNLQVLRTCVFVRALKDGNGDCANIIGLEYLTSLQKFRVWIDCEGASAAEVDEAEAALRNQTDVHPNRPALEVYRCNEVKMISSVQDQEPEDDNLPKEEEEDEKQQEEEADDAVAKLSLVDG
ncbi:disease resistance protein RGA5-like isoform X2 [Phragmites australis]|uniref:disease resistance protein RGA5-like isoform X2 n=1 Tax=Phragmites australis TaxID=29695 RepID=UPI002D78BDB3|nr:disease resistance protein RGA5-like isoform X2 [Phragmites australis]XP_062181748.1 disease resistance protein RGA5-like isoform X2 [Phragmites australis]XP_062181749.1 disease resistance protein RGA5-like isoform X2 [Phragmites australis]XP_062181750.1 disease resistance protein RGA5-like isoform X2 [Phragmites australis]XP_062181751.1 disease resistance protein RGA5-like isoform X2 [Phragmites australis]XP_062181752.1 disease resistance protein RGA5-like isoform X2 [Phragmites australis]